jgi:hypothetical protein
VHSNIKVDKAAIVKLRIYLPHTSLSGNAPLLPQEAERSERLLLQIIGLVHEDRARRARQFAGEFNLNMCRLRLPRGGSRPISSANTRPKDQGVVLREHSAWMDRVDIF